MECRSCFSSTIFKIIFFIKSIITIIIPSENCAAELKSTIDNLVLQTKIKGTKILVLDNKSNDGSVPYAAQAAFDLRNTLSINVIDASSDGYKIKEEELNPYVLWIKPGVTFRSKDSIINMINSVMRNENILILTNGKINFFNSYYLKKGKISINCLMCKKNDISLIDYKKEGESMYFPFSQKIMSKKYRIVKESLYNI